MNTSVRSFQPDPDDIPLITSLDQLADLATDPLLYLRYSKGPAADAEDGPSRDHEANVTLPGLSATTLSPEPWWRRPVKDWVARRVCKYSELAEEDGRFAWLLTGRMVGRGPDHEPLLVDVRPHARLSRGVLDEAKKWYDEHFDVGNDSRRST
ncbi:DUF6098 family protein [Rhodococcus pyridinivorans]|uniref:DUF6098 family protein n=1 Tax=Rhodococcus pyridinivorans TaxID=103816 RepID=UPI0022837B67|nr:DUF6098 family protein [Rhodococcus pyridinivorans]WAL45755.1 DUF6098 family protein [Rhodococcus pyridinivorans]